MIQVAANARHGAVLCGAAVDGDELADGVAVADLERGWFAAVLLVLRIGADRRELEDPVAAADAGGPFDDHVGPDARARTDPHAGTDHRVRADLDVGVELGARVDDCTRMDAGHAAPPQAASGAAATPFTGSISRSVHINSASAATWPSTVALPAYFQIEREMRRISTSSLS